jgi:UDP-glucose 4-epimerase
MVGVDGATGGGQVVLVTGVSRYIGGRFARLLSRRPGVARVIGVDVVPPAQQIGDAEFVRADIRNPVIAKVIAQAEVDTVVHLNVLTTPVSAGGRTTMKEINVIGTMQLLAACQRAGSVRRLVVKGSASVYGSSPRDPAMFTEEMHAKSVPRSGFAKDSIEVEGYVRAFSRRRPDVQVSVLRFANIIGPGIRTAMTDYFTLPVVPVVLGFDGRLQFVHEDDALQALLLATVSDGVAGQPGARAGTGMGMVNVAGDGIVSARQAARLAGRPVALVPMPAGGVVGQALRRTRLADFSAEQVQLLAHGRVLDTTRMRRVLGLEPEYTTVEAFTAFVRSRRGQGNAAVLPAGALVGQLENWVLGALGRPSGRTS